MLVLALAGLGALVVGAHAGGRGGTAPRDVAGAGDIGAAGVAAAYGYPLRCLSVTIAATDHNYARADFNRASPCGRYDGPVTAILHRVNDAWRPVLDAISYSCPVASLPLAVQAELTVCP